MISSIFRCSVRTALTQKKNKKKKDSRHLQMSQSPVHFPPPVQTQAAQTKQWGKVKPRTDCLVNDCSSLDNDYLFIYVV